MDKRLFILPIIALALLLVGCQQQTQVTETVATEQPGNTDESAGAAMTKGGATVELTANGFNPQEVKIKAGDTVTWINKGKSNIRVASGVHPTHENYPGTSTSKCGTDVNMFDSCDPIEAGESWSFTFNEKGTWSYHDHFGPSIYGKVIVE